MKQYQNVIKLMNKKFKKDSLIAVATVHEGKPVVRMVDAYFEESDKSFYAVTYTLSDKMKQIATNPEVAVAAVDWFTGFGIGENCGWVKEEKNREIMEKVRKAFAKWYTGGHVNEDDKNTCLLRIKLTRGLLVVHSPKYESFRIDFNRETVQLLVTHNDPSSLVEHDGRSGVLQIEKPQSNWAVVQCGLNAYKDKKVKVKFSADVKRLGASGNINWQINVDGYPSLSQIENATTDTWHSMSGEWTGQLTGDYLALYLSTHENNSNETTYLISNFELEVKNVK